MRYSITIFLIVIALIVQGQRDIFLYFNDAGFCGPGPLIQEQLSLFSDNSFEYNTCLYPNLRIVASGHFSKKNNYISLEYEQIEIDTLDKSKVNKEITNLILISEFEIKRDKQWLKNKAGMLIECGKQFGSRIKFFEPRKRRIITRITIELVMIDN